LAPDKSNTVYPHIPIVQMKWFLKPGKTAKGVSLAILRLLQPVLDLIPVPGAKAGIGILLDVVEGIDVSIMLLSF
jgi:hypothetical protein